MLFLLSLKKVLVVCIDRVNMWIARIGDKLSAGRPPRRVRSTSGGSRDAPNNYEEPSIVVSNNVSRQNGQAAEGSEIVLRSPASSLLYSLCRKWAWPAVTFRSQTHPHEAQASIVDAKGDTVLHWACFGKPPLESVQALLEACPELASTANKRGQLPIHGTSALVLKTVIFSFSQLTENAVQTWVVAASYRASAEVIEALLQSYPEGAGRVEISGSMPLHLMCDYGASLQAIEAILATEYGAQSVHKQDQIFTQRPLRILNSRRNMGDTYNALTTLRRIREQQRELRLEGVPDDSPTLQELEAKVQPFRTFSFWRKAATLLQIEHRGGVLDRDRVCTDCVLHACAGVAKCPSTVLELAILMYPEQLMEQNERGQVPLHVAIARPGTGVMMDLLQACPPEALRVKDMDGFLPVQLAVSVGRRWGNGVGSLLVANPEALETMNVCDVLYPRILSKLYIKGRADALFQAIRAKPNLFI